MRPSPSSVPPGSGVFDPPPAAAAVPWGYLLLAAAAVNAAQCSTRPPVEELRER
ncbi:hypothetical protein ACFV2B_13860 [Streptomyces lavendulae]|uniref:hypothetical protein n=1 Tax=Streptomyces lavendulae TaxID=1914 RepID=UPI0036C0E9F9